MPGSACAATQLRFHAKGWCGLCRVRLVLCCCSLDYLQQECSQKKVFVLPAFETAPLNRTAEAHVLAKTAASQSKEGLLKMVEQGQLWQFALKLFKQVRSAASLHQALCKKGVVSQEGKAHRHMQDLKLVYQVLCGTCAGYIHAVKLPTTIKLQQQA